MLSVVENDFEQPIVPCVQIFTHHPWRAIGVSNVFEVALRQLIGEESVSLVRCRGIYVCVVLGLVSVENSVALLVVAFTN